MSVEQEGRGGIFIHGTVDRGLILLFFGFAISRSFFRCPPPGRGLIVLSFFDILKDLKLECTVFLMLDFKHERSILKIKLAGWWLWWCYPTPFEVPREGGAEKFHRYPTIEPRPDLWRD